MLKFFPYRYRVLVLLCSFTMLTYLDRICISIIGVRLKEDLHLNNEQFGWVLASFALAYALFEIPSGALGDRKGPRLIIIRIVLLWSLFTVLTGMVTGLISLIIVRFLFGVGESGTIPNSLIVVSRWFPVNETGRALTWVGIGTQMGAAVAPLLILPIATRFGWRMPFFVNGVIGVIWVGIFYLFFRNFPSEMKNISVEEKRKIESECRHRKETRSVSWRIIFKNKTVWALMLMYFCYEWALYFFIAWMPVYLQEGRHFSEVDSKPVIFSLFLTGIGGYLAGGFIADLLVRKKGLRFARRFVGMCGMGLCAFSILLTALVQQNDTAAILLVAGNGFYSFGVMSCFSVCADIGRNNAGTVSGAMNFFGQLGSFFLAIVFGKLANVTGNFSYPLFAVAGVLGIGCLLWLMIDPLRELEIAPAEQSDNSQTMPQR